MGPFTEISAEPTSTAPHLSHRQGHCSQSHSMLLFAVSCTGIYVRRRWGGGGWGPPWHHAMQNHSRCAVIAIPVAPEPPARSRQ